MKYEKGISTRFEDTPVWKDAVDLAVIIYSITKKFPSDEIYAMTSQMRRSATSVSANIAEGYGRVTKKDKVHFYTMSYGSLMELKSFLYLSQKLEFIKDISEPVKLIEHIQDQINAIRNSLK
ncbi:MAG TPA: four helix bundle protein [Acinetobacter johnsonii]|nr:four helix bundle protein [Acinetobacter johnsonii]